MSPAKMTPFLHVVQKTIGCRYGSPLNGAEQVPEAIEHRSYQTPPRFRDLLKIDVNPAGG